MCLEHQIDNFNLLFPQIDNINLLWYDGEQEDEIEGHCVIFPYTSNVYALATSLPHLY